MIKRQNIFRTSFRLPNFDYTSIWFLLILGHKGHNYFQIHVRKLDTHDPREAKTSISSLLLFPLGLAGI